MSYTKNILSNFATSVFQILIGAISSVIIARALGAKGNGEWVYFLLIFNMITNFGHLGINNSTPFFCKKTNYKKEEIFGTNISFIFILWSVILVIGVLLKYFNIFLIDYELFFILEGFLFVIFGFITNLIKGIFIGEERIVEINKFFIINNSFFLVATMITWLFGYLNIYLCFTYKTIGFFINAFFYWRKIDYKFSFKINKKLLSEELKYGIVIYLSALFIYLNYRADQILIKDILNSTQLGIYSIGVFLAELVFIIPKSVTTALNGKLYNISNSSPDRKYLTTLTLKYTFYLSVLLVFIGLLMTPLVPFVYGEDFIPSITVIQILFIGTIFASIGKVSAGYFFTKGKPKVHLVITFFTLVFNIVMNLILIPHWGINGVAVASTIAYISYGLLYLFIFKKFENFGLRKMFLLDREDINLLKALLQKRTFLR